MVRWKLTHRRSRSLTCIFLATPSNCVCSNRIRCAMRNGGVEPSLLHGSDPLATRGLPKTKCICTAAWSVFRASSPCHITGYRCRSINSESACGGTWLACGGVDTCKPRPGGAVIAGTKLLGHGIETSAIRFASQLPGMDDFRWSFSRSRCSRSRSNNFECMCDGNSFAGGG